ncbi:MAG TPA: PQQ-dependent sugar dehydrogenase [Allosphingosinicella sp.]|jgi:hypothetical protein
MRSVMTIASCSLLAACSGGSASPPPPPPPPPNSAPSFTSAAAASVPENSVAAYTATASDPDGNVLTYSIVGGADAARFTRTAGGALSFVQRPNFEAPADVGGDNIYVVQIQVSDGQATASHTVQITVTDDREGIALRRVGTGFDQPVYVAAIPGDRRVWVIEKKAGQIKILDPATGAQSLFMSVRHVFDPVTGNPVEDFRSMNDSGLHSIVAQPDYATSGYFYVSVTTTMGRLEVRRYRRGADGLGNPRDMVRNLTIDYSLNDSNYAGWLGFGPNGQDIYIATGEGTNRRNASGTSQNTNNLLGKILRVRANPDPFGGATPDHSFVPAPGNPFLAGGGDPRVFAYGLRRPYRASFYNGQLLIGEDGMDWVEEVNLLRPDHDAGANYGWDDWEGTRQYRNVATPNHYFPVTEYRKGLPPFLGTSIVGGYVYRGPIQSLAGHYVFGDAFSGKIWTVPFQSFQQGNVLPSTAYETRNLDFMPNQGTLDRLASFGEDAAGNLYIVDLDGDIFMVTPG